MLTLGIVRQCGALRLRRCGANQAVALRESHPPGRRLRKRPQDFPRSNLSYQDYLDWKKLKRSYSSFDVWKGDGYSAQHSIRRATSHGRSRQRWFLSHAWRHAMLGRDFSPVRTCRPRRARRCSPTPTWQKRYGDKPRYRRPDRSYSTARRTPSSACCRAIFISRPASRADFWTTSTHRANAIKRRSCHNLSRSSAPQGRRLGGDGAGRYEVHRGAA